MDEEAIPLFSRAREVEMLRQALCARQSRLVTGAAGAGKSRLLREAIAAAAQPHVLVARWPGVLHDLLVSLAVGLGCGPSRRPDLRKAPSASLKALILKALADQPRCVLIEDARDAEPRTYRFLQRIYHLAECCLVLTATSRDSLGSLKKLLWDPREEIALPPLRRPDARRLFDLAARRFALEALDLEDFRGKVLASARGNPGQIVTMCKLASRSEYRPEGHIHFLPLRIDMLTAFLP